MTTEPADAAAAGDAIAPRDASANDAAEPADAGWSMAPHDPLPDVPGHGGPVLAHLELVTITFTGYAFADTVEAYGDWIVGSSWLDAVGRDYGVGKGSHVAKVRLSASPPASDNELRALITAGIANATLPAPDANTLYAVYLPPGTAFSGAGGIDCKDYSGFHSEVTSGSDEVAYALIGACDGYVSGLSLVENVERTASHEIIEAATNPRWRTAPAFDLDDTTNAWAIPEGEIGDICRLGWDVRDGSFVAQRVWSNSAARAGAFPCVPAPAQKTPYFNVSVSPRGTQLVDPGQTITLTVRGWSTAPVADWVVHVPTVSVGDFAAPAALSSTTIGNGKEVTLTLTVPASATSKARSYLRIASAATAAGLPQGDFWPVALQVK